MIVVGIDARGYSVWIMPVGSRDRAGSLLLAHDTVTAFHPYISLAEPINQAFPQLKLMMPVKVVRIGRVPPGTVNGNAGSALLK